MQNDFEGDMNAGRLVCDRNTSCSKDDAIRYLMDERRGRIRKYRAQDDTDSDNYMSLYEILDAMAESAEIDYSNAKVERLSDDVIVERLAELNRNIALQTQYLKYRCDIDNELAKGDKSVLLISQISKNNSTHPYVTLTSLDAWAKVNYPEYKYSVFGDAVPDEAEMMSATHVEQSSVSKLAPLTKGQIATAFQDMHYSYEEWEKYLATTPKWLLLCRVARGNKSTSATWDPTLIAAALFDKKISIRRLDAVFVGLKDWADEWERISGIFRE